MNMIEIGVYTLHVINNCLATVAVADECFMPNSRRRHRYAHRIIIHPAQPFANLVRNGLNIYQTMVQKQVARGGMQGATKPCIAGMHPV